MYEKFIARQPIFDAKLRVFAYELLFRAGGDKNVFQPRQEASSSVIVNSMMLFDLQTLTGHAKACINVDQSALQHRAPRLLPCDRVIIEILETVVPTPDVIQLCRDLCSCGYVLALEAHKRLLTGVDSQPVRLFSFATVLFAALAFVVALLPDRSAVNSDSLFLRQGHFVALAVSSFVCAIFAGVYYVCSRWLHLSFRAILSALHFISVFLPLVVFSSLWYLTRIAAVTAQPEPRVLRVYGIDLSTISNVLKAIFFTGFLLFALNILSALFAKLRLIRKAA